MRFLIPILFFTFSIFPQTQNSIQTKIQFTIDTRFGAVNGSFKDIELNIKDESKGIATVKVNISSIETGIKARDNHLKNEDFFDVKNYPTAIFELLSLSTEGEKLVGKGKLTIKGITKNFEFPVTKTQELNTDKYEGNLQVNRRDFKLEYDSIINPIKDNVTIEFSVVIKSERK